MKSIKKIIPAVAIFFWLSGLAACTKEASVKNDAAPVQQGNAANINHEIYYTNSKQVMYVVGFINTDTKRVFTTILFPNNNGRSLDLPDFLSPGHYDISITPEGASSGIVTHFTIGGISGSFNKYPGTVRNTWLSINSHTPDAVSIILR